MAGNGFDFAFAKAVGDVAHHFCLAIVASAFLAIVIGAFAEGFQLGGNIVSMLAAKCRKRCRSIALTGG